MRLTDEHIFKTIKELLPEGNGRLTYEKIAIVCECHYETVKVSVRRLQHAGRLEMTGGRGRKPVSYRILP